MSGNVAKRLRKMFPDRREYRRFKKVYLKTSLQQRREVLSTIRRILTSKVAIHRGVLNDAGKITENK